LTRLSDLLTDAERKQIRAPIEQARTFPRRAFIDENFYQFEVEQVLCKSWIAVSFASSIPKPGDVCPITILGFPLLLVRGNDGLARAFHNVCPYDSCEVSIKSQQGLKSIITPYHGWEYDLDGKLLAANYWDGSPDSKTTRVEDLKADLIPVPCEEWMHTLFIHLEKNPSTFAEQYHAVLTHFEKVDLDRLEIGIDRKGDSMVHSLPINANWKTVYENYSPNVYHESFVHEMYRKSPHSPRVDANQNKTYTEINDPSGFLGLCYDNKIGASLYGESKLPNILNKDGGANGVNTISNVFPNWVITVLGNAARISIFLPTGPETGQQFVATLFDREGATDPDLVDERVQSAKAGIVARVEDNLICESIQRARHSPALDSQFYSPFWDAMHYTLTNLILDRLEQSEKK
jgi:choline monooxygenase